MSDSNNDNAFQAAEHTERAVRAVSALMDLFGATCADLDGDEPRPVEDGRKSK